MQIQPWNFSGYRSHCGGPALRLDNQLQSLLQEARQEEQALQKRQEWLQMQRQLVQLRDALQTCKQELASTQVNH